MNPLIPLILDESRASLAPALTMGSCVCQWLCWQNLCSPWPPPGTPRGTGVMLALLNHRADPDRAGSLYSYPLPAATQKCLCKLLFCVEGVKNSAVKLAMLFHLQRKQKQPPAKIVHWWNGSHLQLQGKVRVVDSSGNRQVGGKSPKAEVVSAAKTVLNSSGETTITK